MTIIYGTWNPTVTFDIPGNLSCSYNVQEGNYMQVKDDGSGISMICVDFHIKFIPSFTTASGVMRIGGLPYTVGINDPSDATNGTGVGTFFCGNNDSSVPISMPANLTMLNTLATPTFNALHFQGMGPLGQMGLVTTSQVTNGVKRYFRGNVTYLTNQ